MSDIEMILQKQRDYFKTGKTKDLSFRIEKLKLLKYAIENNEKQIMTALEKDLNKSPFESYETEIGMVLEELKFTIKNLKKWAKPKKVRTPLMHFISSSYIYHEPYGISLIMSPWNYPFQLSLVPLIGSMAAGNCSVVKPSAYSPNTSELIANMIAEYFDKSYITVVLGGREANQDLLTHKFDYIFFTGSIEVGKIVMQSASKYLTPITLELGGKSPCIVDRGANMQMAAKRIVWGKFLNAGQTCVAPDYLLVHKDDKDQIINLMGDYIKEFYGDHPVENKELPKIINHKHWARLNNLMQDGRIVVGGKCHENTLKIEPTIMDMVSWEHPIMQQEVFGPILPILEYDSLEQVIQMINDRPKPLALYFFSSNKTNQAKILKNISFGGGCINDTIVHLANPNMPFGGVGNSGMGEYHGKKSFETFSHTKSILKKSNLLDIQLRYPPFENKLKILKKFLG